MLGYTAKMYAFQEERILMMKIALPYKEEINLKYRPGDKDS